MLTLPDVIIPLLQPFKVMFQARDMVEGPGAPNWGNPGDAQAHRHLGAPGHGAQRRHELCPLPPRSQPCRVVAPSDGTLPAVALDPTPRSRRWPTGVWDRRGPLERRGGRRIKAKGIYRDGVRSSASHFVKASGLRWVSLMWLAPIPWAHRTWALPVLTALAPSERYYQEMGRTSQKSSPIGRVR